MSPRASGIARDDHEGSAPGASAVAVAQPASSSVAVRDLKLIRTRARSGKLDVRRPFVLAAVRVEEGHPELAGVGGAEREREERILADRLRGVEGGDGLAEVRDDHLVDVVVLLLEDLPRLVALDA